MHSREDGTVPYGDLTDPDAMVEVLGRFTKANAKETNIEFPLRIIDHLREIGRFTEKQADLEKARFYKIYKSIIR